MFNPPLYIIYPSCMRQVRENRGDGGIDDLTVPHVQSGGPA